jgi:Transglycosylase SLT domain
MLSLYYRLALSLLFACVIIASAGTSQAPAEATQAPVETSQAPAETNSAVGRGSATDGPSPGTTDPICPMIEAAARANGLPMDFFTRVIWRESRFRPDEVGPVTRSGQRAQGIAQFMPGTAAERGLLDPFDPVEALPKSGKFLAELRDQFGNLGLAAAAYNAGPQRVRNFLAGLRVLPLETRNYVRATTGYPLESWVDPRQGMATERDAVRSQTELVLDPCPKLMAQLKRSPDRVFLEQRDPGGPLRRTRHSLFAEQSRVPYWCRYLHHPKVNICGSVHQ